MPIDLQPAEGDPFAENFPESVDDNIDIPEMPEEAELPQSITDLIGDGPKPIDSQGNIGEEVTEEESTPEPVSDEQKAEVKAPIEEKEDDSEAVDESDTEAEDKDKSEEAEADETTEEETKEPAKEAEETEPEVTEETETTEEDPMEQKDETPIEDTTEETTSDTTSETE